MVGGRRQNSINYCDQRRFKNSIINLKCLLSQVFSADFDLADGISNSQYFRHPQSQDGDQINLTIGIQLEIGLSMFLLTK